MIKTVEVGGHTLIQSLRDLESGALLKSGSTNNSRQSASLRRRRGLSRLGWRTATGFPFPRPVSHTVQVHWSSPNLYSLFQGTSYSRAAAAASIWEVLANKMSPSTGLLVRSPWDLLAALRKSGE